MAKAGDLIPQVVVDANSCRYDIVPECIRRMQWTLVPRPLEADEDVAADEEQHVAAVTPEWTLLWCDTTIATERLIGCKPFQIANHIPGMLMIARKAPMAKLLGKMKALYPTEYDFSPSSWVLPDELDTFRRAARQEGKPFILKPSAGCQGKGIQLILGKTEGDLELPAEMDQLVAQEYVEPFLLDGYKFDLRVYVLVLSVTPLRILVFRDGLARLATAQYQAPTTENFTNVFMHLTNYAINKLSDAFSAEDVDHGFKRSIVSVFNELSQKGVNIANIWTSIDALVIKTLLAAQPHLEACIAATNGIRCFELLGFDVILNKKQQAVLLEVNHAPSLRMETPADDCKRPLIMQTLALLDIDPEQRVRWYKAERRRLQARLYGRNGPTSVNVRHRAGDSGGATGEDGESDGDGFQPDATLLEKSLAPYEAGAAVFAQVYPVTEGSVDAFAHIRGPPAKLVAETAAMQRRHIAIQQKLKDAEERARIEEQRRKAAAELPKPGREEEKRRVDRLTKRAPSFVKARQPQPKPPRPNARAGIAVPIKTFSLDFGGLVP
eukprot:TRINITY_DN15555_c0_g1_i1.p1 TRINITY_DN15555_c0_g1~~TRINITY_DN15555_c0_g1_i1.p1  ORF type:complete len:552 (+),score=109.00 TRINITY_DN15555_c0_g1_i1:208-1863(+)